MPWTSPGLRQSYGLPSRFSDPFRKDDFDVVGRYRPRAAWRRRDAHDSSEREVDAQRDETGVEAGHRVSLCQHEKHERMTCPANTPAVVTRFEYRPRITPGKNCVTPAYPRS